MYSFIEASPKRHDQFKMAQEGLELVLIVSLKGHAATRWESHKKVLKDMKVTNPVIMRMLQKVMRKDTTSDVIASKRDAIILAGDFNAKTGSGWNEFRENIGKYGKGLMNSSGRRLLEMCKKNNLYITNTTFKHKKSHRTTWSAPYRSFETWNGELRRNPVRNQIDYIIEGL